MKFYNGKRNISACTFLCLLSFCVLFQSRESLADENVYRELIERGVATYEDGCRAISAYVDIKTDTMVFEEVVLALKKKEIADRRWRYKSDKILTRGIMVYMIFMALDMKGDFTIRTTKGIGKLTGFVHRKLGISNGFTMPDIGMGRRYAYLAFQYNEMVPRDNKSKYLTGHDLLALMYRIEQHIKAEDIKKQQKRKK
jgi:hypothetical protein